jgi:hypothetical protein
MTSPIVVTDPAETRVSSKADPAPGTARPSFSAYPGIQSDSRAVDTKTWQLADRVDALARMYPAFAPWLAMLTRRLRGCVSAQWAPRCGLAICPRCQAHVARRNAVKLERRLVALDADQRRRLRFVRLSVAADHPKRGLRHLRAATQVLRRRTAWTQAVVGGELHIDLAPAVSGSGWNVHLHAIVELRAGADLSALPGVWCEILTSLGVGGSVNVKSVRS